MDESSIAIVRPGTEAGCVCGPPMTKNQARTNTCRHAIRPIVARVDLGISSSSQCFLPLFVVANFVGVDMMCLSLLLSSIGVCVVPRGC